MKGSVEDKKLGLTHPFVRLHNAPVRILSANYWRKQNALRGILQPTKFEINLTTAKGLGLIVPSSLLARASDLLPGHRLFDHLIGPCEQCWRDV
jgi:hypothetical protein